jgi:Ctr copper transporter family
LAKLTPGAHSTVGSTFGACVGLFFLAAFYRFLFAVRATAELKWISTGTCQLPGSPSDKGDEGHNYRPPFSIKTDPLRGLIEGLQSFVGYFLMLAVCLYVSFKFERYIPLS